MFIEQDTFNEIKRALPLNAVELLVQDENDNVLIFKRANEPAKNQWWIPGGRVLHGEKRIDAATRLLKEECGITDFDVSPFKMLEYTVKNNAENHYHHIISTVYLVKVTTNKIGIDSQTSEYNWKSVPECIKQAEHDFLKYVLAKKQNDSISSFVEEGINSPNASGFISNDLYSVILKSLSVPCVDILVSNPKGEILLVKRKNEPAKNEWWVPGGRVHFGEKRIDTAKRKLKQECGLTGTNYKEIGDFEFIFKNDQILHDIATLYDVTVSEDNVHIDDQSSDKKWLSPEEWLKLDLSAFIKNVLTDKIKNKKQATKEAVHY